MKQIEKDIYEKIILKIRKETHYSLKLNKKNIKRELEKFIYMMASCYNDCWTTLTYLDEIETEHIGCIKSDNNMDIANRAINIIQKIYEQEAKEYEKAIDGILKLAIENAQIRKVLKEDIPYLANIKFLVKSHNLKDIDYEPIFETLACFYLNYNYDDNIKKFISNLNEILKEIVENGALNDNCLTPEEGGTIHE